MTDNEKPKLIKYPSEQNFSVLQYTKLEMKKLSIRTHFQILSEVKNEFIFTCVFFVFTYILKTKFQVELLDTQKNVVQNFMEII